MLLISGFSSLSLPTPLFFSSYFFLFVFLTTIRPPGFSDSLQRASHASTSSATNVMFMFFQYIPTSALGCHYQTSARLRRCITCSKVGKLSACAAADSGSRRQWSVQSVCEWMRASIQTELLRCFSKFSPSVRYMRHHCTQKTSYLQHVRRQNSMSGQVQASQLHTKHAFLGQHRPIAGSSPLRLWPEVLQPLLEEVDCSVLCREVPAHCVSFASSSAQHGCAATGLLHRQTSHARIREAAGSKQGPYLRPGPARFTFAFCSRCSDGSMRSTCIQIHVVSYPPGKHGAITQTRKRVSMLSSPQLFRCAARD